MRYPVVKVHESPSENGSSKKKVFKCYICDATFSLGSQIGPLMRHILTKHIGNTIHKCFLCCSLLESSEFLESHIKSDCKSMVGLIGGISNQKGYPSIYSKEQNTKPETPRYFVLRFAAKSYEMFEFRTNLHF